MHSHARFGPAPLWEEQYYARLASMPSHFMLPVFGLASKNRVELDFLI